jgi:transcriptional regulator with XRE-family HTH domain
MIDVADMLARARMLSGLSRRQVAIQAAVSPSTVTRIENGQLDPTVSVFEQLLAACGFGYSFGDKLIPIANPDAARAARRILDPEAAIAATEGSERLAGRWEKGGLITSIGIDRQEIARRAGHLNMMSIRPGKQRFAVDSWQYVARALRDRDLGNWAITGGVAALRYTSIANAPFPVVYVEDPIAVGRSLALKPIEYGPGVTLLPLDDVSAAGIEQTEDGGRWAAPWQVAIDAYASNGRSADQAESMIDILSVRAV